MGSEQLIGTWKLVSFEGRRSDGEVLYPYGTNPVGILSYDQLGYMSVQMMLPGRPSFSASSKSQGTLEETKAAFDGYEAYFGTYDVDEEQGIVIHHVEGSLFPNWTHSDQTRFYQLSGDRLTISTAPMAYSGTTLTNVLEWERAT